MCTNRVLKKLGHSSHLSPTYQYKYCYVGAGGPGPRQIESSFCVFAFYSSSLSSSSHPCLAEEKTRSQARGRGCGSRGRGSFSLRGSDGGGGVGLLCCPIQISVLHTTLPYTSHHTSVVECLLQPDKVPFLHWGCQFLSHIVDLGIAHLAQRGHVVVAVLIHVRSILR